MALKLKSKSLPLLMLAVLCHLGMHSLAFVGASTASEESAVKPFVSATAIVKFLAFFYGLQFIVTYIFTDQSMKAYWADGFKTESEHNLAHYLMRCLGQSILPWFLLTVIMLVTDTVSKEFMLMGALHFGFGVFDIFRMLTTCEGAGVQKESLYAYIPLCAVLSYLSYATLSSMDSPMMLEVSDKPLVSGTAIAKFQAVFNGFQFILTYIFTDQALKGYWADGFQTEREQKIAHYLVRLLGQNQLPWFLLSVIMLMTDRVSKEYVLTNALYWAFLVFDIFRAMSTCESAGIKKQVLYPYILIAAIVSCLSYTAWQTM